MTKAQVALTFDTALLSGKKITRLLDAGDFGNRSVNIFLMLTSNRVCELNKNLKDTFFQTSLFLKKTLKLNILYDLDKMYLDKRRSLKQRLSYTTIQHVNFIGTELWRQKSATIKLKIHHTRFFLAKLTKIN